MQLPKFITKIQDLQLLQDKWASVINPVLSSPTSNPGILNNIALINGVTVINHLLGAKMQGWVIIDISAPATIYRSAPLNDLTLSLTSNAATTVSLMVF